MLAQGFLPWEPGRPGRPGTPKEFVRETFGNPFGVTNPTPDYSQGRKPISAKLSHKPCNNK